MKEKMKIEESDYKTITGVYLPDGKGNVDFLPIDQMINPEEKPEEVTQLVTGE